MKEHKKTNLDISVKVPGMEASVKQRMNYVKENVTESQVQECATIVSEFAPADTAVEGIVENKTYEHPVTAAAPETRSKENEVTK